MHHYFCNLYIEPLLEQESGWTWQRLASVSILWQPRTAEGPVLIEGPDLSQLSLSYSEPATASMD